MNGMFWAILGLAGLAVSGLVAAFAMAFAESAAATAGVYEREMARSLEEMFLFVPVKRLLDLGKMLAAVVFLLLLMPFCRLSPVWVLPVGVGVAGLGAVGAFFLPQVVVRRLKARRLERFNLQLLDALPMLANALRAGFSINQAFESVAEGTDGPMHQEISLFLQQLRVGVSFNDALAALERRVAGEDLTLVCTAIDISRRSGGNLTEIFDTIAETIRARMRIHQHVKSLTAQGRLQGLIIGAMPFLLGIGMFIFKPAVMRPFVFSVAGALTLLAVTLLVALGGWVIRRIVTIDV